MLVRPATPEDVPIVLPMVRALIDLHESNDPERFQTRPDVLDRYAAWLPERAADPWSVFLVAQDAPSARLVGFAVCTIEPEVPIFWIPECGWVHDVWVDPSARRTGIARALVRAVIARFEALGVKQIRLHTGVFNDTARRAFSAEGFRPCVVEMLRPIAPPPGVSR